MGAGAGRVHRRGPHRLFPVGTLLRRHGPVPGILAAHRPGAIMDKSGRRGVVRFGLGQGPKSSKPKPQAKAKASTISASY